MSSENGQMSATQDTNSDTDVTDAQTESDETDRLRKENAALRERVGELEETVEDLADSISEWKALARQEREVYREEQLEPRLDSLEEDRDDAREERVELRESVDGLQSQMEDLQARQENILGVQNPCDSGPAKRAIDVRVALIRRAKARSDKGAGHAKVHHQDVEEILADHGHGSVSKPARFRAMEEAAKGIDTREFTEQSPPPGFDLVEDGGELKGRSVKVVRCQLESLPDAWADEQEEPASRNPTTGMSEDNLATDSQNEVTDQTSS